MVGILLGRGIVQWLNVGDFVLSVRNSLSSFKEVGEDIVLYEYYTINFLTASQKGRRPQYPNRHVAHSIPKKRKKKEKRRISLHQLL